MDLNFGNELIKSKATSTGAVVGDGKDTSFWEDAWVVEVPMKLLFPKLYDHFRDKRCTVSDC